MKEWRNLWINFFFTFTCSQLLKLLPCPSLFTRMGGCRGWRGTSHIYISIGGTVPSPPPFLIPGQRWNHASRILNQLLLTFPCKKDIRLAKEGNPCHLHFRIRLNMLPLFCRNCGINLTLAVDILLCETDWALI